MAGIYIHIPFCTAKCSYCDFFSKVTLKQKNDFISALFVEMEQRKEYINSNSFSTIYFGGGTPSILSANEIDTIINKIRSIYNIDNDAEITLEANPNDLTLEYIKAIKTSGINRLSIGIQSFHDSELKAIKRIHTAQEAEDVVQVANSAGITNISIDLIYGLPNQTLALWKENIEIAVKLPVMHLSVYGLSYEEGTLLWHQKERGKIIATSDQLMNDMYYTLLDTCMQNNFSQYEISSFAKAGLYSRHNSSYWNKTPYIGFGPSAHSFNGNTRQWNIHSIPQYCKNIMSGTEYYQVEQLSKAEQYNDHIMLRLRTTLGLNLTELAEEYGDKQLQRFSKIAEKHLKYNNLKIQDNYISLTRQGVVISDNIISDFMEI